MKSMRLKSTLLHVIFLYARQKSFLSLHLISLRFLFFILYIHLWMSLIFWNKCWNGFTKTNAVAASLCPRRIYWMLLLLLSCDIERSGEDGEVETFFFFWGREKRKKKKLSSVLGIISLDDRGKRTSHGAMRIWQCGVYLHSRRYIFQSTENCTEKMTAPSREKNKKRDPGVLEEVSYGLCISARRLYLSPASLAHHSPFFFSSSFSSILCFSLFCRPKELVWCYLSYTQHSSVRQDTVVRYHIVIQI